MGKRAGGLFAVVYFVTACGGSEFQSDDAAGGGSGNGGTSNGGTASGGTSGSGGTTSGGTSAGGSAGAGNTGGANLGGSAGVAPTGGAGGTGPLPITIVNESETMMTITLEVPSVTLTPAPSAGNAVIVGITMQTTADDCTIPEGGVTDNQGNTYTRVVEGESVTSSAQGARPYIFIAENIGTPSGPFVISVDPSGTVPPEMQYVVFGAIEVAGLGTAPSLDASGISLVNGDAGSTSAITDLSTTQNNELAVGVLTMRSDHTNMLITPETGWTTHHANQNGAASHPPGHSMISLVTAQPAQISHTWTHVEPTRGAAAVIATFRGALP